MRGIYIDPRLIKLVVIIVVCIVGAGLLYHFTGRMWIGAIAILLPAIALWDD